MGRAGGWIAIAATLTVACPGLKPEGAPERSAEVRGAGQPRLDAEPSERCFDRERYLADLRFVARERVPGSEHWRAVQDLCADRLESLGYVVERVAYGGGTNVIATLVGTRSEAQVIVGAHYDSTPGCPGADDNATGVAGMLQVAEILAGSEPARTLVLACWDDEERGLFGSEHHASSLRRAKREVALAVSLEMIGYRSRAPGSQRIPPGFAEAFPDEVGALEARGLRGDFIAVIGSPEAAASMQTFRGAAARVELPAVLLEAPGPLRIVLEELIRSDHASFWRQGMPAMMVTDSADFRNPGYHCESGRDTVDPLDADFAGQVVEATAQTLREVLAR